MKTFALLLTALALARPACAEPAVDPASIRPALRLRPGPALMTLRAAEASGGRLGSVVDGSKVAAAFVPVHVSARPAPLAAMGGVAAANAADPEAPPPSHMDRIAGYVSAEACTGLLTCWKDAALSLIMSPFHGAVGLGGMGAEGSEGLFGKIVVGGASGAMGLFIGALVAPLAFAINIVKGVAKAFDAEFL